MMLAYARVSTIEQAAEDKVSISEQLRRCKTIADLRGEIGKYKFATYTDKGVSGSVPFYSRPGGRSLLAHADRGDTIITSKMDRIFRSGVDALNTIDRLKRKGIELIICDMGVEPVCSSPVSSLFFAMLSSFAQFERERIAERIAEGKAGKKARNGFLGGHVPFGYKKVGEGKDAILVEDEKEQEAIKLTRKFALEAPRNTQEVARLLARQGYLGRDGQPYSTMAIYRMLKFNPQQVGNG